MSLFIYGQTNIVHSVPLPKLTSWVGCMNGKVQFKGTEFRVHAQQVTDISQCLHTDIQIMLTSIADLKSSTKNE